MHLIASVLELQLLSCNNEYDRYTIIIPNRISNDKQNLSCTKHYLSKNRVLKSSLNWNVWMEIFCLAFAYTHVGNKRICAMVGHEKQVCAKHLLKHL